MFRPLPKHLKADQDEICNHLAAAKDVDCMTDLSNAGVFTGKKLGFAPCTPQACRKFSITTASTARARMPSSSAALSSSASPPR